MSSSDQLRFDDRVAIVTGAGAGLGREYALLFAERGAKVIVNDLDGSTSGEGSSKAADIVVNEIRAKGGVACANYDSVTDGEKVIKTAMDNYGRVDILVNNAGILLDQCLPKNPDQDLNIILDVHLRGSFETTQSAWAIFKNQNYGRIIMITSNLGIYGNFGQANYSATKLAFVGLANTLAIEGGQNNIHCNCIVATAASPLTQYVLPVVAYLCHESSTDNGVIIESAAGWATKLHTVRGKGTILRTSLAKDVTPEKFRDAWDQVVDMSKAERMDSIIGATGSLDGLLCQLDGGKNASQAQSDSKEQDQFSFGNKHLILYALGVGASVKNSIDLKFLYENHPEFSPLPTFFIIPSLLLATSTDLVSSGITHTEFDWSQVFHHEQYLEVYDELITQGNISTSGSIIDVIDKQSGAVVVVNCESHNSTGKLLFKNQLSTFVVGAGNYGGKTQASGEVKSVVPAPNRPCDASIKYTTSIDQAALYRLSGDLNPMHIDPEYAKLGGYKVPIVHGLCTLGFSVRAVLSEYADNDATLFKAVKSRFTNSSIPGQTLEIQMWQNGNRIHFKTIIADSGVEVITGAYVDLKEIKKSSTASATTTPSSSSTSSVTLKSDIIFTTINDRTQEKIEKANSVKNITRGSPHKRGHQHHVRNSGNRCSTVDTEQVLAALRAGDQIPIAAMIFDSQSQEQNVAIANELMPSVKMTNSIDSVNNPNFGTESQKAKEANCPFQGRQSKVMKDHYKLAWFKTDGIDPDIIRTECERFGPVQHCHQFNGISFPLFNRREDAQTALMALRNQGYFVEFANCRPYGKSQAQRISLTNDATSLHVSQINATSEASPLSQIIQRCKFDDLKLRMVDVTNQEIMIMNSRNNIISCILSQDYKQFVQLNKDVQNQGQAQAKKPPYEPLLKEICLALINDYWYRVEYQQELIDERAQVALIDYGSIEVVSKRNIRAMLKNDECFTLLCAVRDILRSECDKILRSDKIHAKKIKCQDDATHFVWLNDVTEKEEVSPYILTDEDSDCSVFSN